MHTSRLEGCAVASYETHELYVDGKRVENFQRPEPTIPDSPGHIREFLDSIKSRQKASCDMEYDRFTKGGLLGNLAFRVGRKLVWDDEHERIVGDQETQSLVTRCYRKPGRLVL